MDSTRKSLKHFDYYLAVSLGGVVNPGYEKYLVRELAKDSNELSKLVQVVAEMKGDRFLRARRALNDLIKKTRCGERGKNLRSQNRQMATAL